MTTNQRRHRYRAIAITAVVAVNLAAAAAAVVAATAGAVPVAVAATATTSAVVVLGAYRAPREPTAPDRTSRRARGDRSSPLPRRRPADGRRRRACLWVSWSTQALVDHLLARAVRLLPDGDRERWTEEWADHRTHRTGLGLLWWAVCVYATASRTAGELRHARLPRPDGDFPRPPIKSFG